MTNHGHSYCKPLFISLILQTVIMYRRSIENLYLDLTKAATIQSFQAPFVILDSFHEPYTLLLPVVYDNDFIIPAGHMVAIFR